MRKMIRARLLRIAAGVACCLVTGVAPSFAQYGSQPARIDLGGENPAAKSVVLPLDKAAIVELPRAAADVLVSKPEIVDAVIRTPRRVYLLGVSTGQANAFFFDAQGRQILNLEIQVERDVDALRALYSRVLPDARIEIDVINDNIILRGKVQSAVEAANASDLARRFVPSEEQVVNLLAIREPAQVMLKVRIVEMQRSILRQIGVRTNGTVTLADAAVNFNAINTVGTATAGLSSDASIFNLGRLDRLDLAFQALESNGLVRVLAEPNLTAISGEAARFLAGGEFPVPVGQNDGVISIEFKQFGVGLGFSPVVLNKGRINLEVETEVSEITNDNAVFVPGATTVDENGNFTTTAGLTIPGLSVRRANTVVEIPSGGSLVMAGLLQEDMRQDIQGVPGVKDVPVLGALFRSREYQNSESELVIVVTPYLVEPTHESKLAMPDEDLAPASALQALLLGQMLSRYGLAGSGVQEAALHGPMGFILD